MKKLLPLLPKPSRYAGAEDGVYIKDPSKVSLRVALAFPDTYEVGMSYLGHKILYDIINSNSAWWAERVMTPEPEAARILRAHNAPLCTLESDTPLKDLNAIGFAVTHELCFTDVLHMLDLSGIPMRSADRGTETGEFPLIMAGGGAMLGAEALTPFLDLVFLGDGEELVPETLKVLEQAINEKWSRKRFFEAASRIPGVYIPSFFKSGENGALIPLYPDYRPVRRIAADLDKAPWPSRQVLPVGALHNRLTIEIARGCTRGCRFCHAGMVYRPVRERAPSLLDKYVRNGLENTGFEELSFLGLSVGDYSAFRTLWKNTFAYCHEAQAALSLPSLRAGSVDDEIMADMASLRRTGCTIAPEAGSQRLRNVINKGISEEEIIQHAEKLATHGWRQIKLYFMIGLPTETDDDLRAIANLCARVRDAGYAGGCRLNVTASISPFVPKPFTPFQWEEKITHEETERRLEFLRGLFGKLKNCTLKWHDPSSSFLEGLLSRADRRMADVIETAYHKGAVYCAWTESFRLEPWLEAMRECGLEPAALLAPRTPGETLPWSHIEGGVSESFLLRERARAFDGLTTPDCRYAACNNCGACDRGGIRALVHTGQADLKAGNRLVFTERDQGNTYTDKSGTGETPDALPRLIRPRLDERLAVKATNFRIWHRKMGPAAFLSQLELQAAILRYLRRAGIPLAFSQGFHPKPLISFGRALPVSMESEIEWFSITLNAPVPESSLLESLNGVLPKYLKVSEVEERPDKRPTELSEREIFAIKAWPEFADEASRLFSAFAEKSEFMHAVRKKQGFREENLRPYLKDWARAPHSHIEIDFITSWKTGYVSPLVLVNAILEPMGKAALHNALFIKTDQIFADGEAYSGL